MRRIRALPYVLILGSMSNIGCGDDGSTAGDDSVVGSSSSPGSSSGEEEGNRYPTVQLTMDSAEACGDASSVEIRSTRYACVDPPPAPCTLSEPLRTDVGTQLSCPGAGASVWEVELRMPGRYYVELVSIAGGVETKQCVSNRDDPTIIVDDAEFNTNPTIEVMSLGEPCPVP